MYKNCQSDDVSRDAFGIDPVFLSTSSLYNQEADRTGVSTALHCAPPRWLRSNG